MNEKNIRLWIERLTEVVKQTEKDFKALSQDEKSVLVSKTNIVFLLGYLSTAEMMIQKGENYD